MVMHHVLFAASWALLMQNLPGTLALPGIEKFLYLTHNRNVTMFHEMASKADSGIEKRVIADQPILTFLDICKNGIGRNSLFEIECFCSAHISPPSFGGTCESTRTRCLNAKHNGGDLICGYPEVGFHFDAIAISEQHFPLEMHVCFHEHHIFGTQMSNMMPTCFNFIGPRVFNVLGIGHSAAEYDGGYVEEPHASRCTVTHGDEVCDRCIPCIDEAGQIGMNFDCESLQANLTSSDHCITLGNLLFS